MVSSFGKFFPKGDKKKEYLGVNLQKKEKKIAKSEIKKLFANSLTCFARNITKKL